MLLTPKSGLMMPDVSTPTRLSNLLTFSMIPTNGVSSRLSADSTITTSPSTIYFRTVSIADKTPFAIIAARFETKSLVNAFSIIDVRLSIPLLSCPWSVVSNAKFSASRIGDKLSFLVIVLTIRTTPFMSFPRVVPIRVTLVGLSKNSLILSITVSSARII